MVDELGEHLEQAFDAHKNGEDDEASRQLRLAADTFEEPEGVPPTDISSIQAAAELRQLASELARGKEVDDSTFRDAFQKAYRAGAGDRWRAVSEDEWLSLVGHPDDHFRRAEQLIGRDDRTAASDELLKASVLLELESTRTAGEDEGAMSRSMARLDELALRVAEHTGPDAAGRRAIFVEADYALAHRHLDWAGVAIEANDLGRAGHELMAAVRALDYCAAWLTDAKTANLESAIEQARRETEALDVAGHRSVDQTKRALAAVAAEIDAFASEVPRSSIVAEPTEIEAPESS